VIPAFSTTDKLKCFAENKVGSLIFAYGGEQQALVLNPFEDIDRPEVASPPLVATARIDDHLIIWGLTPPTVPLIGSEAMLSPGGSVGTLVMAISHGASSGCCRSVSVNASRRGCFSALVKSALATAAESAQLIFP
jgi:hypothetical protein